MKAFSTLKELSDFYFANIYVLNDEYGSLFIFINGNAFGVDYNIDGRFTGWAIHSATQELLDGIAREGELVPLAMEL